MLDPQALEACVGDYRERGPVDGVTYHGFAYPSGGRGDLTAVAVAHAEGERIIVDAVRAWRGDVATVAPELAAFLRSYYHLHGITGDNYGADVTVSSLQRVGIVHTPRPPGYDKSRRYLELLPLVLGGRVLIPNDTALLRELRSLEHRRGFAGRDRVDTRGGDPPGP